MKTIAVNQNNIESIMPVLTQLRIGVELDRVKAIVATNEYEFLGFQINDSIIGVCGFRIMETITRKRHCHIHDLVIDNNHRNMGHGRTIIEIMKGITRNRNGIMIYLDAIDSAMGFYENIGFAKHPATLLKISVCAQQGDAPEPATNAYSASQQLNPPAR